LEYSYELGFEVFNGCFVLGV